MTHSFELTSTAFAAGDPIPAPYTCTGRSISPPLSWTAPPEGTQSLALVVDDPDAPNKTFVHWVLFNLPPDATMLPEGVNVEEQLDGAALTPAEGANDFGDLGYGPPCPPRGDDAHHYSFRLYALDTVLDLEAGITKKQLTQATDGHILAEADLMGTFRRSR